MLNRRFIVGIVASAVVATAGCSSSSEPAADAPSVRASAPTVLATDAPAPSPSPSASPDNAWPTEPPDQQLQAGTVADGTSATLTGEGSAEIEFVREGDIAVVVDLDCSACAGPTVLTAPDRVSPLDEADDAMQGSYLVDVFADTAPEQSLWLVTEGEWTLELSSWNDLPSTTGSAEGSGSTVLFLVGDSARSVISWTPAHGDDVFQGRFFGVSEEHSLMFGDSIAFSEPISLQRPGVLAISTDGEWSIEP